MCLVSQSLLGTQFLDNMNDSTSLNYNESTHWIKTSLKKKKKSFKFNNKTVKSKIRSFLLLGPVQLKVNSRLTGGKKKSSNWYTKKGSYDFNNLLEEV